VGPTRARARVRASSPTSPISTARSTSSTRLSLSTSTTSSEFTLSAPAFTLVADNTPDGPQAQVKRCARHHSVGPQRRCWGTSKALFGHLQDCAAFPHLAATFTREVEAGHLSIVAMQATCRESQRNRFANVVCTEPFCLFYIVGASGRNLQNNLSLARLRRAPRLCT